MLSCVPWQDAMVSHFWGRDTIWLERSELLLCPDPDSCQGNTSAKILGISLFLCAQAHQRPMIVRNYVIPLLNVSVTPRASDPEGKLCATHIHVFHSSVSGVAWWREDGCTVHPSTAHCLYGSCRNHQRNLTMDKPESLPGKMLQHWP